jgi:hypothetical protein
MLRFCDSGVVAAAACHAVALCVGLVLGRKLKTTVSVFPPAPPVALASRPGHPEELPQLDTQSGQDLA